MNFRKFRGLAAVTIAAALVLSGCGSSGDKNDPKTPDSSSAPATTADDAKFMNSVQVTADTPNEAPSKVEFDTNLTLENATAEILTEGTGRVVEDGELMKVNFVQFSGLTGEQTFSTYEKGEPQTILQGDTQLFPALTEAFSGQKIGTRLVFGTPAVEGTEQTQAIEPVVFVMEISDAAPAVASGEEVPQDPANPQLTIDADGKPQIELPDGFKVGSELKVIPLIKGDGPVVSDTAYVTSHYTGWKASNGEQFDSSWDRGTPFAFSVQGGVIQGWMDGVKGQTVGSRVLLLIPKDLGYGGSAGHELENEDLVFVVDILGADG
ncbi:FKBP-type peptidyl-prolyl cis-trans isomerase [Jonesiaceae bacterium BS-20]|uniref:peptidylprolyl isomerase n=1 Tax=Jonesiaceae bacterium BS-20 TaxID=3120821 RepID=A0AAU7DY06_9MICO